MDTCKAHNRRGERCRNYPARAQLVCHMHGAKEPHAIANAETRMRQLIHPAVSSLARQIEADEFQAVRYVLDWAGFKAAEKIEGDQQITITVKREEPAPLVLDRTIEHRLSNGHNGTHD